MLSGFISIEHNLKGPSLSHVTACAASTHALNDAMKTIVLGGADRILVVGAEKCYLWSWCWWFCCYESIIY